MTKSSPHSVSNWWPVFLLMGLIFLFSSLEQGAPLLAHFPLRDKGAHFVVYAVLGWLCADASVRTWPELPPPFTLGFAFCIATGWGVTDELHQYFVPGRTVEAADLLADALGSGVGVLSQQFKSTILGSRSRRHKARGPVERDDA